MNPRKRFEPEQQIIAPGNDVLWILFLSLRGILNGAKSHVEITTEPGWPNKSLCRVWGIGKDCNRRMMNRGSWKCLGWTSWKDLVVLMSVLAALMLCCAQKLSDLNSKISLTWPHGFGGLVHSERVWFLTQRAFMAHGSLPTLCFSLIGYSFRKWMIWREAYIVGFWITWFNRLPTRIWESMRKAFGEGRMWIKFRVAKCSYSRFGESRPLNA